MIKKQIRRQLQGFTLIEILIVVAIIAILASIILVGLGPTQSLGRDSRRLGDLHDIQNGLELYYARNGAYPTTNATFPNTTWLLGPVAALETVPGINSVPSDPSGLPATYNYESDTPGSQYIVEATLENGTGGAWSSYVVPANQGAMTGDDGNATAKLPCTVATKEYCLTL